LAACQIITTMFVITSVEEHYFYTIPVPGKKYQASPADLAPDTPKPLKG
jgi:hypothetical protein